MVFKTYLIRSSLDSKTLEGLKNIKVEVPQYFASLYGSGLDTFLQSEDQKLSNIHEPLSNLEKRVYGLERQNDDKDRRIKQLEEKSARKKRKSKVKKRKAKSNKFTKMETDVKKFKKIIATYLPDWRYTKDAHMQESRDTTKE